jgi:hypothetical protein
MQSHHFTNTDINIENWKQEKDMTHLRESIRMALADWNRATPEQQEKAIRLADSRASDRLASFK